MGTITILVTYRKGSKVDYNTFSGSGTDPDVVLETLTSNAKKKGWRISDIEIVSNTFNGG